MKYSALAGLLGCILAACGGDGGPTEPAVPSALVGNWYATPACTPRCFFRLAWTEQPAASMDMVSGLGMSVEVGITRSGQFSLQFSGGTPPAPGTVEVKGSTLYVRSSGGVVDTIDFQVDAGLLRLDLRKVYYQLDFNGDGQLDPSRASAALERR